MNNTLKQTIAKASQQFIFNNKLNQAQFAHATGVSQSVITHILKENSTFTISAGNNKKVVIADKYFKRLAEFIGYELSPTFWENQATPQLTSIIANLEESKQHGTTKIIIGETGGGKSHAINLFKRKYVADTFIITAASTDNLSDLIDKIIDKLGITTGKTKSKKLQAIALRLRSLKEDGLNPQLIFDESEYMKQPALAAIKFLYDLLNKYCSIILIGTEQLIDNINMLRKKNKPGMPQFYRRIKFGIRYLPAVDRTFKLFLNEIESNEVKKFLRLICNNYGELHDVLVPVKREAERTDEPITEQFIRKVLNLPIRMYA